MHTEFCWNKFREISSVLKVPAAPVINGYFILSETATEKDLNKCCDRFDVTTMKTCQAATVAFDLQAGFQRESL